MENSAGLILVDGSNLLDWAVNKNIGCSFSVPPDATGTPISQRWYAGTLEVNIATSAWTLRLIDTYTSIMWINSTESGIWKGWKPLATATPPAVYDLPLAAGWGNAYYLSCQYHKNQFNEVTINMVPASTTTSVDGALVATIPVGFRPTHFREYRAEVRWEDDTNSIGTVSISVSGEITLWVSPTGKTVKRLFVETVPYVAA